MVKPHRTISATLKPASMTTVLTKALIRIVTLLGLLFVIGCATREPLPAAPEAGPALPGSFSATGVPDVPGQWWQAFGDEQLNGLVHRALAGNLELQASFQRLRQARALADRQGAARFPSLEASAGAQRQTSNGVSTNTFSAGLTAAYEVDLWGRVQSLADAEQLRAAASEADYEAAAVSLAGEIANTWFALLEQRAQLRLAKTQLDTNQNVLKVIESRFAMGQGGSADVLRQRQLVNASRERLSSLAGDIAVLEHQLAVLLGRSPGRQDLPAADTLPALPPLPEIGVPATLLQRRPDLQRAWQVVRAADQDLAAAISNRFPRVSLEASASSQADDAGALFDDWLATLAGNLVLPLVDGGQRRAEVRRSEAVREELLRDYGQAVITAIQEVEDALARERQQRLRLQSLESRIELADTAYRQLRNQYLNGAVSYLEVLTALQDRQDLQRTILTTRQQLLTTRVGLYRALAGPVANVQADNPETRAP